MEEKSGKGRKPNHKLNYFYLEVDYRRDMKIRKLNLKYPFSGIAVFTAILDEIYGQEGYYVECEECLLYDFADYFKCEVSLIKKIVSFCCLIGLFNKNLYKKHNVLSSKAIQSRWSVAMRKLNRIDDVPTIYNLFVDEEDFDKNFAKNDKENYEEKAQSVAKKATEKSENKVEKIISNFDENYHVSDYRKKMNDNFRNIFENFDTNYQPIILAWLEYKETTPEAVKSAARLKAIYTDLKNKSDNNVNVAQWIVAYAISRHWNGFRIAEESNYKPPETPNLSNVQPELRPDMSKSNETQQPENHIDTAKTPEKIKENIPTKQEFVQFGLQVIREQNLNAEQYLFSLENKFDSWKENNWRDGNKNKITNWKLKLKNTIPYLKPLKTNNYVKNSNDSSNFAESRERDYQQKFAERTIREFAEQIA
ncbi:MAG: DUF4373 domain-containing protein [Prevotellaceae bacterium]|nr:DUF4373 domain-containing protein [Prevotellaceae bacterium]